jgi:heptosyltransferase I
MNIQKILIVKLSSLGDVLHNLPIFWDLRKKYPDAQIDWVVEEAYVDLLRPLAGDISVKPLNRIIPLAFRRWKKDLRSGRFIHSIQEYIAFKRALQSVNYDLVIDTQGLFKSAWVANLANLHKKAQVFGLANQTEFSGYESIARWFYTDSVHVPFRCHSVDRSRWVVAAALNEPVPSRLLAPPKFYPRQYVQSLADAAKLGFPSTRVDLNFDVTRPYVLCFHSTAGASKRWSNGNWIKLAKVLSNRGIQVIFPWGNNLEKKNSEELAKGIANAIVPNSFTIFDAFGLIAGAEIIIGVDTGLTHLAAVLEKRTIEIYCDSPAWKTDGYWDEKITNLGDKGSPPTAENVIAAIDC